MDPASLEILFLLILIILSSYFSMSETALTSINKLRLRNMVEENVKNAKLIESVLENPKKLLSAILIGNNLVNIAASAIATSIAIEKFGNKGIGIATGILTLIILIFGEITPKTFATQNAEKISIAIVKPIIFCIYILTPFIFVLNKITEGFLKLIGVKSDVKNSIITEAELLTIVNLSHEEGVLEVEERQMISNVVDFGNSAAKDIMVPRTDIVAISVNCTYKELIDLFKKENFTRIPIFEESIDNIIGIVSLKDILFNSEKDFNIKNFMREPYFTYESKSLKELFSQMKLRRISMSIILDEYGGTAGLVTMEDILEEIVGDISDEYDETLEEIKYIKDDEYIVDASTKISDVNEMLQTNFESDDFDSIGGFVIGILGRFPEKGEIVEYENITFIVEEIDKNRIELLRILININKKEDSAS